MTPKDKPHESKGKPFCMRLAYPSVWDGQRGNGQSGMDPLISSGPTVEPSPQTPCHSLVLCREKPFSPCA